MTWANREGKEVHISKLDSVFILHLLDRLHGLAIVKQEMLVGLYEGSKGKYFQDTANNLKSQDWRDFVDIVFHDLEHEAATRQLGWKPKPLSAERKVNLNARGALERYIVGAIRDTVNAHGPITKDNAPSAAKRIIGAIKTWLHDQEKQ